MTLALLGNNENVHGLVTASSGNHGRALATIAKSHGLKCAVVCPKKTAPTKVQAIRDMGAEIIFCEATLAGRQEGSKKVVEERGYHYIPSSDHYDTVAGQGTIGLELLEQVPDLDAILVAVSGGGMITGIGIVAKATNPNIKVFAVEPEGKGLEKCLRSGERLWPMPAQLLDTVCDGLILQQLGTKTFPMALHLVEKQVFTIPDQDTIAAMRYTFQNLKLVVEAAAGAAVAAAMSKTLADMDPALKKVGVILCGGNADIDHLPWQQ